ncbi:HipA domain-containing protein [Vibrio splendidus]
MAYSVYQVPVDAFDDFEDMGTKSKFWYTDPETQEQYLFKSTHTEDKNEDTVVRTGEDWAEKIACELARLLGLPHAEYDLATHNGEQGIRTKKFTMEGDRLIAGNILIEDIVTNILNTVLEPKQQSHTVARVISAMDFIITMPPKGWEPIKNVQTAKEVFVGYVLLDCLISNQDRHNENWAMVTHTDGSKSLAPTFDHAASLGRNESDEKREAMLRPEQGRRDVSGYVKRCKSWYYIDGNRLKTLEAFAIFSSFVPEAAVEWLTRLESIRDEQIHAILDNFPAGYLSVIQKEFCFRLITENKQNILNLLDNIIELSTQLQSIKENK